MSLNAFTKAEAPLIPVVSPLVERLSSTHQSMLLSCVEKYGSPLHFVLPAEITSNASKMQSVLNGHGIEYAIFYGAKVNKSSALMRAALLSGVGIDVSSLFEMRDAVVQGGSGKDLVATGPAKTAAFHDALISAGALVSIDSPEELADFRARTIPTGQQQPILLRLRPEGHEKSRFGMSAQTLRDCFFDIVGDARLRLAGIHFHLSGYRWEDRAKAFREAAALLAEARDLGLSPDMIDIGGGLPVRYVSEEAWNEHLASQNAEDYRTGKVPSSYYPYGGEIAAIDWLDHFLNAPATPEQTISGYLRDHGLKLALEPGRSLVDQAAFSAFRITRVKHLGDGNHVVFVEGSSFSACETWFASEFMVDPILIPSGTAGRPSKQCRVYIAGHSCLDEDVLSNRWLTSSHVPQQGDLLIWANTAGYQMDMFENEFHRHPMPNRVCITEDATGAITVDQDH